MGRERDRLNQILSSHRNTIQETLQFLDQTPSSSQNKVKWEDVIKLGEQVSKQSTIVGMLWIGEEPEANVIEENMASYFNTLQGFLLISHGSMAGAGHTLASSIRASSKQVVDSSFKLMTETVSSYGSGNKDIAVIVPRLAGAVWEACSALNKTPTTDIMAIRRAMRQVAVSVQDVLREMKELKPDSSSLTDEVVSESTSNAESVLDDDDDDDMSDDDLGSDLSPEEMKIAVSATEVVSNTVVLIKELIRITGLFKQDNPDNNNADFIDSLELLLKLCQRIGGQIDEIGACLYPPQEVSAMMEALEEISTNIDKMQVEVRSLTSSSEAFFQACDGWRSSSKQMETELACATTTDIETKMQNVAIND